MDTGRKYSRYKINKQMTEGFDDFEMKNKNMEEEEENKRINEETSLIDDEEDDHNRSINIINTENPIYERVEIPDIKKRCWIYEKIID